MKQEAQHSSGNSGDKTLGKQYQYQQQTADPLQVYRSTLIGQSLVRTLNSMTGRGLIDKDPELRENILKRFD